MLYQITYKLLTYTKSKIRFCLGFFSNSVWDLSYKKIRAIIVSVPLKSLRRDELIWFGQFLVPVTCQTDSG